MTEKFNKIFLLNLVITFYSLASNATESRTICTRTKNNFRHTTYAGAPESFFNSKIQF